MNKTDHHTWEGWAKRASGIFVGMAIALPAWNLLVDPYQVLGTGVLRYDSLDPNERYLKVEHLLHATDRYDSFIIGSSTAGAYPPNELEKVIPGTRFYNLGMLAGTAGDALSALKTYMKYGGKIHHVVYGIDPFTFHEATRTGPGYWQHPTLSSEDPNLFLSRYLFVPSVKNGAIKILSTFSGEPNIEFDFKATGTYRLTQYDHWIERDHPGFIAHKFDRLKGIHPTAVHWNRERLEELGTLVKWLQRQGITMTLFFNPMHPIARQSYGEPALAEWQNLVKKEAGIPIVDLSRFELDEANRNFYDEKHFRPALATRVIDKLFPKITVAQETTTHNQ